MRALRALSFVFVASCGAALSGCVGYTLKPAKPTAMPRADAPAPLKVGVLTKNAAFEWRGFGMNSAMMERQRGRSFSRPMFEQIDDIPGKFVRALQASGAFSQVVEVHSLGFNGSGGDHDLLVDGTFSGRYIQDPALRGKAFITGFLLLIPAPFVRYDDAYQAAAELTLYDNEGRLVHKYSEQAESKTSAALFSAGMPGSIAAGIDSAASHLAARLVATIIADREGYRRAISGRPAGERRKPEPVAAAPADARGRADAAQADLDAEAARHAAAAAGAAAANTAAMGEAAPAPTTQPAPPPAADAAPAEPTEPAQKAAAPKPKKRGPLTPAEERVIDEELLP